MTYQRIRDDEDKDLGQDEASEPIRSTDDSFWVCGCMDTAAYRIGFAMREGRRYVDGGMAWYVCLQGQGETGLYIRRDFAADCPQSDATCLVSNMDKRGTLAET